MIIGVINRKIINDITYYKNNSGKDPAAGK